MGMVAASSAASLVVSPDAGGRSMARGLVF
jgi:hypothetical protein